MTCMTLRAALISPRLLAPASVALASSGLLRLYRPDQLVQIGRALLRYGLGPGCGPIAGAALHPDTAGFVDDAGALTFGQLERRCDALAAALTATLAPGESIGLLGRNSAAFYQVMVAASRSGLDIVYLNTGFSASQIAELAAHQELSAIVHDAEFAGLIPDGIRSIAVTGQDGASIEHLGAGGERPPGRPRHRSRHVILTSGTTGRPKGAARTGGDASSLVALASGLPYRVRETHLIAAPMFHAWGWLNALLTMLYSSTVVVTAAFDPQRVLALVERECCHVLVAVPAMLRRIISLPPEVRRQYDTSSLRVVAVSGSSLPPALAGAFMDDFGEVLYNLYGSTEAGYATVASPADLRAAPGTAGRPLPGVDVRVLTASGRRCPRGTPGDIWVGSHDSIGPAPTGPAPIGTARPASPRGAGRACVRSGDIGWFDAEGRLFVSGRADEMIITGGENVYPAEIENTLERHPGVLEAAVTGEPDDEFGQVVVAHLVLRPGASVTSEALASWCRAGLASFQVPRRYVTHESLPHNAAGKVLKRGLRDP